MGHPGHIPLLLRILSRHFMYHSLTGADLKPRALAKVPRLFCSGTMNFTRDTWLEIEKERFYQDRKVLSVMEVSS